MEKDVKVVVWATDPEVDPKAANLPLRGPKTLRQVLQGIDQSLMPSLRGSSGRAGGGGGGVDGSSPPGPFRTDIRARMVSVGSLSATSGDEASSLRNGVILGLSELPGRRLEYVLEVEEEDDGEAGGGAASTGPASGRPGFAS